jgi:hypothetical protein
VARDELVRAFAADRSCVECGKPIASLAEAALLVGVGRIAHARSCFVPALLRDNPSLSRLAARARAQEVDIRRQSHPTSPHRAGDAVPDARDG